MFRNYLRIALRHLHRHPGYTVLNVVGLAVGVACCLFLLLFVRDELSYDRYHEEAEAIFRINAEFDDRRIAFTPALVGPLLERELSSVEASTRMLASGGVVRAGDRVFEEEGFYFADATFFDVFSHPFLAGDPQTALDRPNTVVLTESTARKFFGEANPVGQTLLRNNAQAFEVTGVLADVPANSHYQFDFLASFSSLSWVNHDGWTGANFYTYVRTHQAGTEEALRAQIDALLARLEAAGEHPWTLTVMPLTDIHLYSKAEYELDATGDIAYVYVFTTAALLVLLIACINYMNLATARSAQRVKEVGVRKALGAFRGQLVGQFYSESALLALSGLVLALGLVSVGEPWFNALSGKTLSSEALMSAEIIALVLAIFLVVSFVAGSYPAFYLSGFRPARALRGQGASRRSAAWLRKGLVVFQFGISAFLIVGSLVVMSQLRFLSEQHLGFDKAHLVELPIRDDVLQEKYPALQEALRQHPAIVEVAAVNQIPGWLGWTSGFSAEGMRDEERFLIRGLPTDARVAEGLGLELVAGRAFPQDPLAPDSANFLYLLNETAVRRAGWAPEEAIGRRVAVDSRRGEVLGVVKDFHFRSLRETIDPLAIWYQPGSVNHLLVRLTPGNPRAAMAHLEAVWGQFASHRPFSYRFLDDVYDRLYRSEAQLGRVVGVFAFLAIFVACLGLIGLAAFTAEQRTKEIGIRKVMGASVTGIVGLLSKDFLRLVAFAFVLAAAPAYFAARRWLEDFAYHVDLGVGVFVLAGVLAVIVAFLAVGYQALRAALADPVKALRYE